MDNTDSQIQRPAKVRGVGLPQEYELAQFISGIKNSHISWNTSTPACEWNGVICEDGKHVTNINWRERMLSGALRWNSLPRTVNKFSAAHNNHTGPVHLYVLPSHLIDLNLLRNSFTGE